MVLPAELVDHIFSFLRGDIPTLRACLQVHPSYSRFSERYLYADLIIQTNIGLGSAAAHNPSELYGQLSKNPHLLYYPRTLDIHGDFSNPNTAPETLSFISMVPRVANLVTLKIDKFLCCSNRRSHCEHFLSMIRDCLRQLSIEELVLSNFHDIPLSVLDDGKNLKKLTLFECTAMDEPMSNSCLHNQSLDSLIIRGDHNPGLLFWTMRRVSRLTSLELSRTPGDHEWSLFPELLTACSSSLRTLCVDVGLHCRSEYLYSHNPPALGMWFDDDDLEFPFTLAACKNLEEVFILTLISDDPDPHPDPDAELVECALPAIVRLLKTAPCIPSVVISFECEIPAARFLGQLDWSVLKVLQGICPRVELRMSGSDERGRWFTREIILDALAGNEVLMDLVRRNLVVLNPGINDD